MVVKHDLPDGMSEQDPSPQEGINPVEEQDLEKDLDDITNIEDVEALKSQNEKAREAIKQLTARAKKAEDEARSLKESQFKSPDSPKPTQDVNKNTLSVEDIEVKILKSKGLPDDEVAYLKKIASVNGTSLIEAESDDLFLAFKAKKEADEKAEKAKLGVSRGGGTVKKEPGFTTPGLTDEQHKELWKKQQGR